MSSPSWNKYYSVQQPFWPFTRDPYFLLYNVCLMRTAHAAAHPFVPCAYLSSRPGGRDGGRYVTARWQPRPSESSPVLYFVTMKLFFIKHIYMSRNYIIKSRVHQRSAAPVLCSQGLFSSSLQSLVRHQHSMSPFANQLHHSSSS